MPRLVAETGWTREALQQWVAPLLAQGSVVAGTQGELLVSAEAVRTAEDCVLSDLGRAEGGKAALAALRARQRLTEAVFALVLQRLQTARRVDVRGDAASLPGRTAEQPAALSGSAARVERMYRDAGLAAPIVSEAAERIRMTAQELRAVLTALLRSGTLVRMGSDALLVHVEALNKLTAELRAKHQGRSFDVAWFKGYTGLTRKHAIPLLEYLDGTRVTRNVGGTRVVI